MSKPSVIVVGAGAAGIGAARALIEQGLSPVLLEARNRIGGRVFSQLLTANLADADNENHVVIQLGANWVHILLDSNPMYKIVKHLNLTLHTTSSDSEPGDDIVLFEKPGPTSNGTWSQVPKDSFTKACKRYDWIRENFERKIKENEVLDTSFDTMLEASKEIFGDIPDVERRCFYWFFDRIAIDLNVPLSLAASDNYLEPDTAGNSGEALIENGYHRVLQHLAEEYPLDIRFEHEVISVDFEAASESGKIVRVECSNGSVFECNYCILTLPIGVLHDNTVRFTPSIPRSIAALCSEVVAGLMNVVWLWYPTIFWPEGCNFLGVAHDKDDPAEIGTFLIPPLKDNMGKRQPILMVQVMH